MYGNGWEDANASATEGEVKINNSLSTSQQINIQRSESQPSIIADDGETPPPPISGSQPVDSWFDSKSLNDEDLGVIPRSVIALFDQLDKYAAERESFDFTISTFVSRH